MNTRLNLKLVAFILGILLWIYVNLVLSPIVRRSFPASIELRNQPSLLRVTLKAKGVNLILDGTRREFIHLRPNAIQATIDLYNLRPGKVVMPVRISPIPGMGVVSVDPSQVEVQAEMLTIKQFEVSAEVLGQTAEGFISEPPALGQHRVKIEGPPEIVEKVTGCKVSIFLSDVKNSISEDRKVTVFTADGEVGEKENIKVIPDKVNVVIVVKEGFPTRNVPVATPTFINKPPEGLHLENFSVSPDNVTITGPMRSLKQVNEVFALPIDLSTLSSSTEIVGLLKAPLESIHIVGTPTVMVNVVLEAVQVIRSFRGLSLSLKNSPNQHCQVTPSSYTLVLKGFVEDLDQVRPNDLGITLDVRGEKPGSYTVELTCPPTLPEKVSNLELLPRQVSVVISEINPVELSSGTSPSNGP